MPSIVVTSSLPKTQVALVAQGPGKLAVEQHAPVPILQRDMVLVRTSAVAINPVDAKMLDYSAIPGAIMGTDFAGTIVALGDDARAAGKLAVGDRVAGLVHGMNKLMPEVGAFCEYVAAYHDLLLKLPDRMSFVEGASLGTGIATACLTLFKEMGVPASLRNLRDGKPADIKHLVEREFVLVAGGATASGTRAIQLLKLVGLRPIATSSPKNFELCKRFGAEKVFDYHSPNCAQDIKTYTGNELAYALDCVTQADTTQLCYSALGRAGGRYVSLEPFRDSIAQTRALTVRPSWVMVLTIFGRKVAMDGEYGFEALPEDREFSVEAFGIIQSLLDQGHIQTHPVKSMPGQWEGLAEGVRLSLTQAQSGNKLVYSVA